MNGMEVAVSGQWMLFLMSCACGGMLGVVYDLLRALRRNVKFLSEHPWPADMLYCGILFVSMFSFVFVRNSGEQRLYIYAGAALSVSLYFLTLSVIVLPVFSFVVGTAVKAVSLVLKLLCFPLVKVRRLIRKKKSQRKRQPKKSKT